MEKKTKVYAFGFKERPYWWPEGFEFVPLNEKPSVDWLPDAPIVVHLKSVRSFIPLALRIARSRPSGRLPEAILYKPKGTEEPDDTAPYFDAVIEEGEEERFVELLSCPLTLTIGEWADEKVVPGWLKEHIRDCEYCGREFVRRVGIHRELQAIFWWRGTRREMSDDKIH
jgi:hypothetical protein